MHIRFLLDKLLCGGKSLKLQLVSLQSCWSSAFLYVSHSLDQISTGFASLWQECSVSYQAKAVISFCSNSPKPSGFQWKHYYPHGFSLIDQVLASYLGQDRLLTTEENGGVLSTIQQTGLYVNDIRKARFNLDLSSKVWFDIVSILEQSREKENEMLVWYALNSLWFIKRIPPT